MTVSARQLDVERFEAALRQAQDLLAAGRVLEVDAFLNRLAAAVPGHPDVLGLLAVARYRTGNDAEGDAAADQAIAALERHVAAMPDDTARRAQLANLLLARGRTDRAEAHLPWLDLPFNPIRMAADAFETRRQASAAHHRSTLVLASMPKAASETVWHRLAIGLGMAQGHVSLGLFPHCRLLPRRLEAGAGVMAKEHIGPAPFNLAALQAAGVDRVFVHVRDPRQALLSWAHFVRDDVGRRLNGPLWRTTVPPVSVLQGPMAALIDWCIDHYLPHLVAFIDGWTAVRDRADAPVRVEIVTFEAFVADHAAYLRRALAFWDIDAGSFDLEAEAGDIHRRRGAVDEWRTVFSPAQVDRATRALSPATAAIISDHAT